MFTASGRITGSVAWLKPKKPKHSVEEERDVCIKFGGAVRAIPRSRRRPVFKKREIKWAAFASNNKTTYRMVCRKCMLFNWRFV